MLFYTEGERYKNIKLVSSNGKDILKFENNKYETEKKSEINLLQNKQKYPFVKWEEVKEESKA